VALVPIAHLGSTLENVSTKDLLKARGLAVARTSRGEAGELVGRSKFEGFDSPDAVVEHVSTTPGALGLVPWNDVSPRVKALSVNGESLLDPEASGAENYPLKPEGATVPDPRKLRRVVVGGDIVLDRGQNYMVIQKGMGVDFPLDGGYAAVTSRVPEPSAYSETGTIHQFTAERTGGTGEVREYLAGADLTLANFENPVIRDAVWHPDATTFTGDLRLMPVLDQAGIDGLTLGNNHILDAGTTGLNETMRHLDDAGIAHAGAGMNLEEARKPMVFDLGGTRVGVLSYLGVPSYDWAWATQTAPGTAPLLKKVMQEDIKRLRPKVDLILVMPHWGMEYMATPEPEQVKLAHAAIDAGADLFIGGHAHWPKGIEMYGGKPIYYGVGNFLLDQSWSEETSTGVLAEVTLYEEDVIQTRPVPFVILDYAQPNFLLPGAGGNRALRKVYSASLGPEFESYRNPAR
jgi:poly-gamma-glutamate synthesis protein (capsule biosynthesis protein)